MSLTIDSSTRLIEKIVHNQGWSEERLQPRQHGMHTVQEMDMLAAKLDRLTKQLDEHIKEPQGTVQEIEARMT